MITEKDIQTRTAEILANAGFNVVASEVDEGFFKPAVFVSAYPSDVQPPVSYTHLVRETITLREYEGSIYTNKGCIFCIVMVLIKSSHNGNMCTTKR